MNSKTRALALALGLGAAVFVSGSLVATQVVAASPAEPPVAEYMLGTLKVDLQKPIDDVYRAAVTAMDKLQLTVTEKSKDELGARLVAREVQGGDIKIDIVSVSPQLTHLTIRIGLLGEEAKSRAILKAIEDNL